jgi:hypothetical protein
MERATRGGVGEDVPDGEAPPPYTPPALVVSGAGAPGTLGGLRSLLAFHSDDVALLERLSTAEAAAWVGLLRGLEPGAFADVVAMVSIELDQPKAARLLGAQLAAGVSVAHVVEAVRAQAARVARAGGQSQAAGIVLELVPLCAQLRQRPAQARAEIEAELSAWERMLVSQAGWPQ